MQYESLVKVLCTGRTVERLLTSLIADTLHRHVWEGHELAAIKFPEVDSASPTTVHPTSLPRNRVKSLERQYRCRVKRALSPKHHNAPSNENISASPASSRSLERLTELISLRRSEMDEYCGIAPSAYNLHRFIGWASRTMPVSPGLSSSSRNSSIPVTSTMGLLPATLLDPIMRTPADVLHSRSMSNDTSLFNVSVPNKVAYADGQEWMYSTSDGEFRSQHPMSTITAPLFYRVIIFNLNLQCTREDIGGLIEEKSCRYVPLMQPNPIELDRFNGQLHAIVKFVHEVHAKEAFQKIPGLKFMGKRLDATLEIVTE